jgi:hypothetical protein
MESEFRTLKLCDSFIRLMHGFRPRCEAPTGTSRQTRLENNRRVSETKTLRYAVSPP